jgi:6-phosphogluconolactonase
MDGPGIPMTEHITEHYFKSRDAASVAVAGHLSASLVEQLAQQPATSLIVTGGSSPARCYAELANTAIDWSRVRIVLSDERWVAPDHRDSNEKLVRETLLRDRAAAADLVAVYSTVAPEIRCAELNALLPTLPLPFASALLGMGDDGHFASLFPDADNLGPGLDIDNPAWCVPVATAASEHLRLSLTLAALLRSAEIVMLFFGAIKRDVYEQAKAAAPAYPVASLLSQVRVPVHVYWAA